MTMSANEKQVILSEVEAARAQNRPVDQQRIRALLPHLSQSAVNSRVARVRSALTNPRPVRRRRSAGTVTADPRQGLPSSTVTIDATTPATGAVHTHAVTSSATAGRADEEVQVAIELARFCGSGSVSSASMDRSEQDDQVLQLRNQVQAVPTDVVSREETIRMQDEDILSLRVEGVQLKSKLSAMERWVRSEQCQLQGAQIDIASRDATIKKLNQDLQALGSDQEIERRKLKSALKASEEELVVVRTQVDDAKADIASKDDTIKTLKEALARQVDSSIILMQRKLDKAVKENASKAEEIEQLKHDMKAKKEVYSSRLRTAQMNIVNTVTDNYKNEVQSLKKQVQDLDLKYSQDVPSYQARIVSLEQDLRYTKWVTDLHTYLVSVEEDLKLIADRLSRFLNQQDRSTLYSKREPTEISVLPTLRWVSHVYGLFFQLGVPVTTDLESSLDKWRINRNYFAHHSTTSDLDRRGGVLSNAQEMHGVLAKLIEDLDKESDADLRLLANDAFSALRDS